MVSNVAQIIYLDEKRPLSQREERRYLQAKRDVHNHEAMMRVLDLDMEAHTRKTHLLLETVLRNEWDNKRLVRDTGRTLLERYNTLTQLIHHRMKKSRQAEMDKKLKRQYAIIRRYEERYNRYNDPISFETNF